MFFAAWCRPDQKHTVEVMALLRRDGAVQLATENAVLAAWSPACLVREGPRANAFAASDRAGACLPGHPNARLDREKLLVTAGPLPQYPVYYAVTEGGGRLIASSQLGPLASLFPSASIDARRLAMLIAYGTETDTDRTVYAGILRLRPCETIVAERDGLRITRDFPRLAGAYRKGNPQDLAVELRDRLEGAVARATSGADRIAVLVSGGLDSSGVLALASAVCREVPGKTLDAISVQYAGPGDDRPYFTELTTALGLAPIRLRPQDAAPWFGQSLCMDAQPGNLASTCLFLLQGAKAVEREADVVLTGVSGDKISGGLFPFAGFTQLARRGRLLSAVNGALRLRLPWQMDPLLRARYVLSPLIPEAVRRVKRRFVGKPERPAWLTARSRELVEHAQTDDDLDARELPCSPDESMRHLCTQGQIADVADALGQMATVTQCFPVDVFLDEDFVRFVLELDPILLSHGHEFRGLYRLAMRGLLPERLLRRQDKGAFEPAIAAASASAVDVLRDLSSLDELANRGLVNPRPLRPMLDACLGMMRRGEREKELPQDEHLQEVWQLLSAEAFLRECGRGRGLS